MVYCRVEIPISILYNEIMSKLETEIRTVEGLATISQSFQSEYQQLAEKARQDGDEQTALNYELLAKHAAGEQARLSAAADAMQRTGEFVDLDRPTSRTDI